MDDLMGKLQEMLSDEESMNQIKQLAEMLGASVASGEDSTASAENCGNMPDFSALFSGNSSEEKQSEDSSGGFGFDIGTLLRLQGLMQSVSSNDSNTELLLALKPHLREEKQQRVDKAVKLLKLFALFTVVKESGLLKSMNLF